MRLRQKDHEFQYYQMPLDLHFIWGETAHLSITIDKRTYKSPGNLWMSHLLVCFYLFFTYFTFSYEGKSIQGKFHFLRPVQFLLLQAVLMVCDSSLLLEELMKLAKEQAK